MSRADKLLNVRLLGTPEVHWGGKKLTFSTLKSLALICCLALWRRPVQRKELAELLWEGQGNPLRMALHRLRKLPGAGEWLEIGDAVLVRTTSDLAIFETAVAGGAFAQALAIYRGEADKRLMQGLEPKDAPAFMDWLEVERARVNALLRDALRGQAEELEQSGDIADALELLRDLLTRDPLDESAHRGVMRLALARGDVPAALRQFEVCRRVLAEELELSPMPETLELAADIERAAHGPPIPGGARQPRRIPPKLLRPPHLAGREHEWAQMEAAFEAGQTIIITGAPGVGKTRLMMDFVREKGNFLLTEGRPGDAMLPLSSLARAFRRFFTSCPEKLAALEPWVHYETARFLPSFFDEQPKPISSNEQKTRFAEAMFQLQLTIGGSYAIIAADDLQFYDPTSFEVASQATARLANMAAEHGFARTIACFRTGEVPAEFEEALQQQAEVGLAVHVDLAPLSEEAVGTMLEGLNLSEAAGRAPQLHKLTGGNPQFVVEVFKSLYQRGELQGGLSETRQEAFTPMVARRLNELSDGALRLARALAAWKRPASTERLARTLDESAFEVAELLGELREAQIISDGRFVHDLLLEAVIATTPPDIERLLHRRIAETLEAEAAESSLIAHHWLEAGNRARGLSRRLKAAEAALAQGASGQARRWLEQVAQQAEPESPLLRRALFLLERLGDED